jgi:hypothetical protein
MRFCYLTRNLVKVILLATFMGCGYGFPSDVSNLPSDIGSIAIPVFANNTSELGIETVFTNEVIDEFLHSNLLPIKDEEHADAILSGTIQSIEISSLAYDNRDISMEDRVTLYVDVMLERRKDAKVLWQLKNFRDCQEFAVDSDPVRTDENRKQAIREIAGRTAEKIHYRAFENF